MHDRDHKKRGHYGETHKNAKLTDVGVRDIRKRYAEGESAISLAAAFGVKRVTIHDVVARRRWKHLDK